MLHGYGLSLAEGAFVTVSMALCSLAVAMLLGLAGALAKLSRWRLLRAMGQAYTTVIRSIPDLVLMLLVFFGGQSLANEIAEAWGGEAFDVDPFAAGVITIGFIYGAYLTETFRGAFMAVPRGQTEAALAFGMGRWGTFSRVIAPQMLRHALPGLSNNWLVLVKSTAIVSVIGLADLMQRAGMAAGSTQEPFLFYGAVAVGYLGLTAASEWCFTNLQRRLDTGSRQATL